MKKLLIRLSERRVFTIFFAATYFFIVSIFHRQVSSVFDWLAEELSFQVYDDLMLVSWLCIMAVSAAPVVIRVFRGDNRLDGFKWVLFTAVLLAISYKTLVVFNVEMIHFFQYALLAVPVFAVVWRFGETVFWVTLCGALDEGFQYFVLYRDNNDVYFDFNDILLNLVGAGIGVTMIYLLTDADFRSRNTHLRAGRKKVVPLPVILTLIIVTSGLFLYGMGLLRFFPGTDGRDAPILLSRKAASEGFWSEPARGKPFHILHPCEGLLCSVFLIGGYSLMDYKNRSRDRR